MSRHVVDIAAAGLVLRIGLRDEALDLSEAVKVRTEGLSFLGIPVHFFDAPPGDAETHGRQCHSLNFEVSHHAQGGLAFFTDQVGSRHAAILEDQLGCHGRPHTTLVLDLLSQGEAFGALLH
eukprot:Skav215008  [mRNA]  locus=scaffold508:1296500:1308299:+ [translate_table: standard]